MIVQLNPSALRETHWYEYLIRFALGGGGDCGCRADCRPLRTCRRGLVFRLSGDFSRQRDADREACPATEREGGVIRGPPRQASGCVGCVQASTATVSHAAVARTRAKAGDRSISSQITTAKAASPKLPSAAPAAAPLRHIDNPPRHHLAHSARIGGPGALAIDISATAGNVLREQLSRRPRFPRLLLQTAERACRRRNIAWSTGSVVPQREFRPPHMALG